MDENGQNEPTFKTLEVTKCAKCLKCPLNIYVNNCQTALKKSRGHHTKVCSKNYVH